MKIAILAGLAVLTMTGGIASAGDQEAVALFNAILASVQPGQTTVEMGDMIVPVSRVKAWRDTAMGLRAASQANADQWPGGVVYYSFHANVTAEQRQHFADACGEWAMFANLTFTPRTTEANYIQVINDADLSGGLSGLGMLGGRQEITIGTTSWTRAVVLHELGHALGLVHEHSRSDRDTYVQIVSANVQFGQSSNFAKLSNTTHFAPYDFHSIMHYSGTAFSDNGENTIVCRAGYEQYQATMGLHPNDRWLTRPDRETMAAMYGPGPALSTVVTNTQDTGPGSLRAAMYHSLDLATETSGTPVTVSFQIPVSDPGYTDGVFTIRPTGRVPGPGPSVTVDGTTQTAFTGNTNAAGPEVVLTGERMTPDDYSLGFVLGDNGSVVRGLVLQGFSEMGLVITGQNNRVEGCYIGTNAAGTAAVPNGSSGVDFRDEATGNTIGGATPAERNVISGNTRQGVVMSASNANVIRGNYIGTNAAGTAALANGWAGMAIFNTAANNTVGPGNVISGNGNQGIVFVGAGTAGNQVTGNLIGLDAGGTVALPNAWAGVHIQQGARENVIGGAGAGDGNVISGNTLQGVVIAGSGTEGNVVRGNYIGINAAGTAALPNGLTGAEVLQGAQGNVIGGPGAADGNIVSGNTRQGVVLHGAGTSGNTVRGNYIGTNAAGTLALPNAWSGVAVFAGATNNTVGPGNVISGNLNQGVFITEAGTKGNAVRGNIIGLNAAGAAALPNTWSGVQVNAGAQGNIIGGFGAADRNIISGNTLQGVAINGTGTTGNFVRGNYIGTNAAGTAAAPNVTTGLEIYGAATANIVGGVEAGAGNVISGNSQRGLSISGAGTNANVVAGNLIGLNAAGTAALANAGPGVVIFNGAQNTVIGAEAGGRNFIAGNANSAIRINGAGTNGTRVMGNSIGVNPAGTVVPNTNDGVEVFTGALNTVVGGGTPGSGNLIRGNTRDGVSVYDAATVVMIQGNSIYGNGGEGIDLAGNGVTANDSGDGDTGPNGLQNFPVITAAVLGTGTAITGTLNTTANAAVRIDYYASASGDEGQYYIGSQTGTASGSGNLTLNTTLAARVPAGFAITATATGAANNTSEFSAARVVTVTDGDSDGMPDDWESVNGLATGSNDAALDADDDGESNLAEFRAGTDPRSSASVLAANLSPGPGGTVNVGFPGVPGFTYRVDYSSLLTPGSWQVLADQIHAGGAPLVIPDPVSGGASRRFYRVSVVP